MGRLLPACLHQAIVDVLPDRLDFYENWLTSEGLRDGSIGLSPMIAVLGFLRTEGPAYEAVMARAGALAATWTFDSLTPIRRRLGGWMPRRFRARAALRFASRCVASLSAGSRASFRVRRQSARLTVKSSLFCRVREKQTAPLCGFYLALAAESLRRYGVESAGQVEKCSAVAGEACVITLELSGAAVASHAALAA